MSDFNSKWSFNGVFSVIFFFLSILGLISSWYFSYYTDRNEKLIWTIVSPEINFSTDSSTNINAFIDLLSNVNTSANIIFSTSPISNVVDPRFSKALEDAAKRGVNVQIYTSDHSFQAPSGTVVRYYPKNQFSFRVNLALLDGNRVFYPSSFFYSVNSTILSYYVYYSNAIAVNSFLSNFFEFFWTLPSSGKHNVNKYKWIIYQQYSKNVNFTWDPNTYYTLDHPNLSQAISLALDDSSDFKIVLSSSFFPDSFVDRSHSATTAYYVSLLENSPFNEKLMSIYANKDYINQHKPGFHLLSFSRVTESAFSLKGCPFLIDGTIIAATDSMVLFPAGYNEVFHEETITIGFSITDHSPYVLLKSYLETKINPLCDTKGKGEIKFIPPK